MNSELVLNNKHSAMIELLLFFALSLSTLPLTIIVPGLILISIGSLKIRKVSYGEIGLKWNEFNFRNIVIGLIVAGCYFGTFHYIIDPFLSGLVDSQLPSAFQIKGNGAKLAQWLLVSWTVAAFGEEIIFRGYLVTRLIEIAGNKIAGKIIAILLSSMAFGMAHSYQGLHGVFSAGLIGVFQSAIFIAGKNKLTIPIIAHGTYDTIGFLIIFLGN